MIFCDHSLQLSTRKCLGKTAKKIHPKAIWSVKMDGEAENLRLCLPCCNLFLFKHLGQIETIYFVDPLTR